MDELLLALSDAEYYPNRRVVLIGTLGWHIGATSVELYEVNDGWLIRHT